MNVLKKFINDLLNRPMKSNLLAYYPRLNSNSKIQKKELLHFSPEVIEREFQNTIAQLENDRFQYELGKAIREFKADLLLARSLTSKKETEATSLPTVKKKGPLEQLKQDQSQIAKYFKVLSPYEAQSHKKNIQLSQTLSGYLALYHAIINNNVKSIYDLDRIDDSVRRLILKNCADVKTFNSLVNRCWEITTNVTGSLIHQMQFVGSNLSKIYV